MSKFDYGNFYDGSTVMEFVVHAKKYEKEEAIDLCIQENDHKFDKEYCNGKLCRKPEISDVDEATVRYYPKTPDFCGCDSDSGCYSYCKRDQRGSFPVWIIRLEDLEVEE